MKNNYERGFTLQAILISTLISGTLISVCLNAIKPIIINSSFISKKIKEEERLFHVAALIKLMTREIDYHRFPIPPRILSGENLTYTNGAHLSVNPSINSNSVASITFKGDEAFVIQHFENGKLYGCFRGDSRPSTATDFLLGISPDGDKLFKSSKELGNNRCEEFTLTPLPSLVLPEIPISQSTIRLIYPVSREYMLYVSKEDELKFLSVKGYEIREHQPIERGIKKLSLTKEEIQSGKLYVFSLSVSGESRELSLPFSHALIRAPSFIQLFNL